VPDGAKVSAEAFNDFLLDCGIDTTKLHAITPAQAKAHEEQRKRDHRANLLTTTRSYSDDEVKQALAHVKRKGWGLDGMSVEKLEEMVAYLQDEPDDY
jgi:hypothetical protein